MTTRPHSDTASPPTFDAAEVDLDALSDQEAENRLFADEADDASGFWSLPTIAGLSLVAVGVAYLMEQLGIPLLSGFDLAFLVDLLPLLAGMLVILIGLGVLSKRPSKKRRVPVISDAPKDDESASSGGLFDSDLFSMGEGNIRRSRTDRKIAGVCGGLADYLGVDVTLVRIAFVIGLVVTGGNFLLAYGLLVFAIPKEDRKSSQHVRVMHD